MTDRATTDAAIGWVGLGMIGTAMVKRLLGAGRRVRVYDRGAGVLEVTAAGATPVGDYRALGRTADLCVVCVYNDAQVRDVVFGQGMLEAMPRGAVLVLHTTGAPALVREIAARAPVGVAVLDATFSGGPHDIAGEGLVMMVGGDAASLARARPALSTYAHIIHHVGGVGSGQTVKLINNLVFATNLMNAGRAMDLAEGQGFDPSQTAAILGGCSGASYAMARFAAPLAPAALLARVRPYLEKDVATAMAAAAASGLDVSAFDATARFFAPPGLD